MEKTDTAICLKKKKTNTKRVSKKILQGKKMNKIVF